MKAEFIGQSAELVGGYGGDETIESAAKTCTMARPNPDKASGFVSKLVERGHMSPLEFGFADFVLECDRGIQQELTRHRHFSFNVESTRWCVAGDTVIKCASHPKTMTVAELYQWKQRQSNNQWKRRRIKQYNEETGLMNFSTPLDITFEGNKPCIEIRTRLGYSIVCTPDHELLTSDGYVAAGNFKVGDTIYVNGTDKLYKNYDWIYYQNIVLDKTFVQIADEFGYNLNTLKWWARRLNIPKKEPSYWNRGRIPWNKGKGNASPAQIEALKKYHHDWHDDRKILKEDTKKYQKHNKGFCEICGSTEDLQVHHIDENRDNNNPTNLITLCRACHSRVHKKNLETVYSDEIVFIGQVGNKDVYDISMKSTHHNFIANGFVAHNCDYTKKPLRFVTKPPEGMDVPDDAVELLEELCTVSATVYEALLEMGAPRDYARKALPLATASKMRMAGNLRTWLEMLRKRLGATAHPEVRELAGMFRASLAKLSPTLFGNG